MTLKIEKYVEKYTPSFAGFIKKPNGDEKEYYFCVGRHCKDCFFNCEQTPSITHKEYERFKEKYPEYFI